MLNDKWCLTQGYSNMGENNESVVAKLSNNGAFVSYIAYGEIKVLEISGIVDFCLIEETGKELTDVVEAVGDDYEVALPVIIEGVSVMLVVDNIDNLEIISDKTIKVNPEVESSELCDIDCLGGMIEDRPELEGLAEALEL